MLEKNKLSSKAARELMNLSFPGKGKQKFQPFAAPGNPTGWWSVPDPLTSSNLPVQWSFFVHFSSATWTVFPTPPSDTLNRGSSQGQEMVIWATSHCKSLVWCLEIQGSINLCHLAYELVFPETFPVQIILNVRVLFWLPSIQIIEWSLLDINRF